MISSPVIEYEKEIKFFSLFKFHFLIEDRRPDITDNSYHGKYKTQMTIKFFRKEFVFIARSTYKPHLNISELK
jgi:hypothetical protein